MTLPPRDRRLYWKRLERPQGPERQNTAGEREGLLCRPWELGTLLEGRDLEAGGAQALGLCMDRKKTGRRYQEHRLLRASLLLPRLTAPHSLQWCFLLVMELKVSPQLLQPCFSLSRLVLEDPLLGSSYRRQMATGMCGGVAVSYTGNAYVGQKHWTWSRE